MITKKTRQLFTVWFQTRNGGNHPPEVSRSYGTYLQNCLALTLDVFSQDDNVREDISAFKDQVALARMTLRPIHVKTTTKVNDAKSALAAFERFIDWIMDQPLADNYADLKEAIGEQQPMDDRRRKDKSASQNNRMGVANGSVSKPECWDSYQRLFDCFADRPLTPEAFYRFGIENSIYADRISATAVEDQFNLLINLLETGLSGNVARHGRNKNHDYLAIRKYSSDREKSRWFVEVYGRVFPNARCKIEESGNTAPKQNFSKIAKCQLHRPSKKENKPSSGMTLLLRNYQCSHVFDDRTKNPLLFEAVWNIVLTPKMIDPLTGHETSGQWPCQFQPIFRNSVRYRFTSCIEKFNVIADKYRDAIYRAAEEVAEQHHEMDAAQRTSFVADVLRQWEPVDTVMEPVNI